MMAFELLSLLENGGRVLLAHPLLQKVVLAPNLLLFILNFIIEYHPHVLLVLDHYVFSFIFLVVCQIINLEVDLTLIITHSLIFLAQKFSLKNFDLIISISYGLFNLWFLHLEHLLDLRIIVHDQLLLILLLIDMILIRQVGRAYTSRRNRVHSRSRETFLGHRLRIFGSWITIVLELRARLLVHIIVLVSVWVLLALIAIAWVELRCRNWLSLILKGVQNVARIGQERLVHGVWQIATSVVWAISLRVI